MSIGAIFSAGKLIFDKIPEDYKTAVKDAVKDKVDEIIMGEKTIEEWCEILIDGIDKIKNQTIAKENLQYAGGRLCFQNSNKNTNNITISFHLYFLNEYKEWEKVEDEKDIRKACFTPDALEEINAQGKIEFDVE